MGTADSTKWASCTVANVWPRHRAPGLDLIGISPRVCPTGRTAATTGEGTSGAGARDEIGDGLEKPRWLGGAGSKGCDKNLSRYAAAADDRDVDQFSANSPNLGVVEEIVLRHLAAEDSDEAIARATGLSVSAIGVTLGWALLALQRVDAA